MQTTNDFAGRQVALCDGRLGLRSQLLVDTHQAEGGAAVLEFVSSTASLDRMHEVIDPAGWRLENYKRNPVFQNSHQYGDVLFTLGKALVTEIRGGALVQRIQFAVEENPIARIAYGLYKGGFLNAVSVGFVPIKWENGTQDTSYRRKYLEQELLEVSAVAIPANPDALALALRSGAVFRRDFLAALEQLASVRVQPDAPVRHLRELRELFQSAVR